MNIKFLKRGTAWMISLLMVLTLIPVPAMAQNYGNIVIGDNMTVIYNEDGSVTYISKGGSDKGADKSSGERMPTAISEQEAEIGTAAGGAVANSVARTVTTVTSEAALKAALEAGEIVQLLTDVELTDTLTIAAGKNVVLDLNGKTISQVKAQTAAYSMIVNKGTLEIADSVGGGVISYTDSGTGGGYYSNTITNNGTLVVSGGSIENNSARAVAVNGHVYTIDNNSTIGNASLTVKDSAVIKCDAYCTVRLFCNSTTYNNIVAIEDNAVLTSGIEVQNPNANANKGSLTISGGTIQESAYVAGVYIFAPAASSDCSQMNVAVSGGTFADNIKLGYGMDSAVGFNNEIVSGGVFSAPVDAAICAEGYVLVDNGDGTYGVVEVSYVAQIGDVKYEALADAFAAAEDGDTITLLEDITASETFTVAEGISITLDMNGKKITATDNKVSGSYELFYIRGAMTVTGNGTIELTATTDRDWNASSSIFHNRGGELNIQNGTFTHNGGTDMAYVVDNNANSYGDAITNISGGNLTSAYIGIRNRMDTYGANGGGNGTPILNITDGEISGKYAVWGQVASAGCKGQIAISGGTLTAHEGKAALLIDTDSTGEIQTAVSGGTFSAAIAEVYCAEGYIPTINADGTYGVKIGSYVAHNTTTGVGYETLAEAIADAYAGETIKLLEDITTNNIIVIDKAITLDGNGKKITSTAGRAINIDVNGSVTIDNLNIVGGAGCQRGINIINKASQVTLNNLTVSGVSHYAVHVATSSGAVTLAINDSNLASWGALAIYGSGTVATVTNSVLKGIATSTPSDTFATIAFGGDNITVNVNGGKVVASTPNGKGTQFAMGATAGGYTNATITLDTELVVDESSRYVGVDNLTNNTVIAFRAEYADELAAEGYITETATTEGMIEVAGEAVARVGDVVYKTLQAAIDAAQNGETVVLLKDVEISNGYNDGETIKIASGKNIILDLNGNAIKQVVKDIGLSVAVIAIRADATLTIKDSSEAGTGKISAGNTGIQLEGTLNLESGTIAVDNPSKTDLNPNKGWAYGVWMYMRSASATAPVFNMTGGSIVICDDLLAAHSANKYANLVACGNGMDGVDAMYDNASINITGGTFSDAPVVVGVGTSTTAPEYVEVIRVGYEVLMQMALALEGQIGVKLYFDLDGVQDQFLGENVVYLVFYIDGEEISRMLVSDAVLGSDGLYEFECKVDATEMTKDITFYFVDGDGNKVGSQKERITSVEYYANYILNLEDSNATLTLLGLDNATQLMELRNLVSAMLNYGGNAQVYFGENTDDLANGNIDSALFGNPVDIPEADAWFKIFNSNTDIGVTFDSVALDLQSETTIRVYFKLAEGQSLEDYTFTVKHVEEFTNGNHYVIATYALAEYAYKDANGSDLYYVDIVNIPAACLDTTYRMSVCTAAGAELAYLETSVLWYAGQVLDGVVVGNNDTDTANLKNLAKALYWYDHYADIFFNYYY